MRRLDSLSDDRARTFGEVLDGERIEHELAAGESGSTDVWVLRDDQLDDARALLEAWRADPNDLRFQRAQAAAAMRRKTRAEELLRLQATRTRLDRAQRPVTPGPVTIGVLIVSAVLTWLGIGSLENLADAFVSLPNDEVASLFYMDTLMLVTEPDGSMYVPFLYSVGQGEVWRLITPVFVHAGGLFHLFFNAYWFFLLGRQIETRKGWAYLLMLVLVTGFLSMFAQYVVGWWLTDPVLAAAGIPLDYGLLGRVYLGGPIGGGLSGVLYGLFGYILAKSYTDKFSGLGMPSSTVALLLLWLLICFAGYPVEVQGRTITLGVAGNIANIAHLGGLVTGAMWGAVAHRIRPSW